MFVTVQQGQQVSTQGTFAATGTTSSGALLPNATQPTPRIAVDDLRVGPNGGLLYNCAPREVVGSVMFSGLGPFRFLRRAEPSEPGPVLGVIASKLRADLAEVVRAGCVKAYTNLVPGQRYYLGPRGTLVAPPLTDPALVYLHFVGFAIYPDTLVLAPSFPLLKRNL